VTIAVDGRYLTKVEADSVEDAIIKAQVNYFDADFGVLESIDAETVIVEDSDGNYVWER